MDYQKIRNKIAEGKEIVEKYKDETPKPVLEVCFSMFDINEMLVDKLEELDNKISKNSRNSSKPPSTDEDKYKKEKKEKTNKKSGGQNGHSGSTLRTVENPDAIVEHKPRGKCRCGKKLSELDLNLHESRQVHEVEILKKVIEHQVFEGVCDCGETHCADFPLGINARAQYGDSVRAVVAYLSKYQLIPYERVQEMMTELFKTPLSEGTVDNICKRGVSGLEKFESKIKEELLSEKSLNVDETPIRVEGGKGYLHVASSKALSFLAYHKKRGMEAVDDIGVLKKFKGLLVHDCFSMYFNYGRGHVICNAHLLRELTFIEEKYGYRWAHEVKVFLLDAKGLVDQYKAESLTHIHHEDSDRLTKEFELILLRGRNEMKDLIAKVENRGKVRGKQHPALNLVNRMLKLRSDIIRFTEDFDLPFTNNDAERDLRMAKVHMKISGCFRSHEGARTYALFRSYLLTLKKQGLDLFEGIKNLFNPKKNHSLQLIFRPYSPE